MKIYSVNDPEFREYGRVVKGYDLTELLEGMMKTPCPADGTIYVPGDPELEKLAVSKQLEEQMYGFIPIQVGYCNGHNKLLNALEYHRSSEFNIAVGEDAILILAKQTDITPDHKLDTATCKAFCVPAGVMVEVYATTLHYAPCQTGDNGFRVVVILPKGTNYDLPKKLDVVDGEEKLMTASNKWLLAHAEGGCGDNAFIGLVGENLSV